jgi:hypothetical protein
VVADILTHTNYITVSASIGYTTTARVITYPYEVRGLPEAGRKG